MSEDNHQPRGILRNRGEGSPNERQEILDQLDRQEVIKNTRLNAQLASDSSKGDQIRAKIAERKAQQGLDPGSDEFVNTHSPPPEHLKWDEVNLYKTEQEKSATMKIDEPKTPYEGGFNPEGEYYKEDEEEIPDFQLGEGETSHENNLQSLNGGQVIEDPSYRNEEEEEEKEKPLSAEERHKKFEEMRKEHYHMKGNALKQKIDVSDEEDE